MKSLIRTCIFAAAAIGTGFCQTGTLTGVVTDTSDAVVAGARITVVNLDTGLRREMDTNETGGYAFTLLPVGRYRVEAMKQSSRQQSRPELKLDVDQSVRLDFTLKPGAVARRWR